MFNSGYNSFFPYRSSMYKQGLFSALRGRFNWSSILSNTQKTLNIINQAIPVFYQIKPMWNNTKTIFKIMGALKEDDKQNKNYSSKKYTNYTSNNSIKSNNYVNDNTPNFFL